MEGDRGKENKANALHCCLWVESWVQGLVGIWTVSDPRVSLSVCLYWNMTDFGLMMHLPRGLNAATEREKKKKESRRLGEKLRTRWETEMDGPDKQADVYGPLFTSSLIWAISSPLAMDRFVGHAAWTPPLVVIHLPFLKDRQKRRDGPAAGQKGGLLFHFKAWLTFFLLRTE